VLSAENWRQAKWPPSLAAIIVARCSRSETSKALSRESYLTAAPREMFIKSLMDLMCFLVVRAELPLYQHGQPSAGLVGSIPRGRQIYGLRSGAASGNAGRGRAQPRVMAGGRNSRLRPSFWSSHCGRTDLDASSVTEKCCHDSRMSWCSNTLSQRLTRLWVFSRRLGDRARLLCRLFYTYIASRGGSALIGWLLDVGRARGRARREILSALTTRTSDSTSLRPEPQSGAAQVKSRGSVDLSQGIRSERVRSRSVREMSAQLLLGAEDAATVVKERSREDATASAAREGTSCQRAIGPVSLRTSDQSYVDGERG